jgi:DNA-binding NarL/FixJ family response regulator
MTRVFLANPVILERFALRLLLMDLEMEVVGEAAEWSTTLAQAPIHQTDMLLVDWNLLPNPINVALEKFREASPAAQVIVLINHQDAHQQATLSAGADAVIIKGEISTRVVECLRVSAASFPPSP